LEIGSSQKVGECVMAIEIPVVKEDKTPCNDCGFLIDTDIHEEELGMCIDCSNAYFTHQDEED
jgi:hypothetical protein